MMYYNKIGSAEGIDLTKSILCIVCHSWYFNHGFKFENSVCNGSCNFLMMNPNINDIAIATIIIIAIIVVLFMALANLIQFICSTSVHVMIFD